MAAVASETYVLPPKVCQLTFRKGCSSLLHATDLAEMCITFATVCCTCDELSLIRIFRAAYTASVAGPAASEKIILFAAFICGKRGRRFLVVADPTDQHTGPALGLRELNIFFAPFAIRDLNF